MATRTTAARCAVAGCGRFVRTGAERCGRHEAAAEGVDRRAVAIREFQERLAGGEYRALFEPALSEVMHQAAEARALVDEIGAVRVALAKLLAEEEDASKLASGVARLASVAIQAAKAQRTLSGEAADGLTEALAHIIDVLSPESP